MLSRFSHVWLFATLWTVAHQAPLSMGVSRQYYWNGLPSPASRRRQWQPAPVLLPGKSRGRRNLVGCSPCGRKERTRLNNFTFTFHFHALEKEMGTHSSILAWRIPGMGAWWAAVYGVAQSRTWLKRLNSSSSRSCSRANWEAHELAPAKEQMWGRYLLSIFTYPSTFHDALIQAAWL